jgi:hypothetical protein
MASKQSAKLCRDIGNIRHDRPVRGGLQSHRWKVRGPPPKPAAGRYAPPRTCQGSLRDPYGQALDRTSPAQNSGSYRVWGRVVGRQNHVMLRSHWRGRPRQALGTPRSDSRPRAGHASAGRAARCTLLSYQGSADQADSGNPYQWACPLTASPILLTLC